MGTITVNSQRLFTLKPDGEEFLELDPSAWDKNRIGEYKKIELECSSDQTLALSVIYFSPALFINRFTVTPFVFGGAPTEGYVFQVDKISTMGTYPMPPIVVPPYNPDVPKNWETEITIGYGNNFTITLKYFQMQDQNSFFSTANQFQHDKLLKDRVTATTELTVTPDSIYRKAKVSDWLLAAYIYQVNPADLTDNSYVRSNFIGYKAGFYNKDAHEAAPYFTSPQWSIEVDGSAATKLSLLENSKVYFEIKSPTKPTDWFSWLIRTDTTDNTVDFISNYEASFAEIVTDVTSSVLDNKILSPSLELTLGTGTTYKGFFHVDKDLLTLGASYRFISVVYDDISEEVNSFISEEFEVIEPSFDGLGYEFVVKLRDYFNDWYGNDLDCTIEERIQSITKIYYGYLGFTSDIQTRLGLTVPNDIRRYLTKITVEIYEDVTVKERQYYDRATAYKTGSTTYSTPSGMTIDVGSDYIETTYGWRNRYESWVPNIQTVISGASLITPTGNQNWGGKILTVATKYELFYDDYVTPFTDEIVFTQQIRVKDYNTKDFLIFKPGTVTKPTDKEYYCEDESICFEAALSASTTDYKLLTTIEQSPGSIASIEENEEMTGLLAQSDSAKFINQQTHFGETVSNRAYFCVDPTKLVYNKFYKVSAISKKLTK